MMIYLGTAGYVHPDWGGLFYPADLPQSQWLEYYSQHFSTVEIEATFFNLPASPVFRHWRSRTPKDFRFFLKGSREITHHQRLRDSHELLATFFDRASELEEKLAGVLWQIPAKFTHDIELLEDFLAEVEREQVVYGKFRQAFEFHDISWFDEPVYEILARYNAAVVLADWPFDVRIRNYELGIWEPAEDTSEVNEHLLGGGKEIRPSIDVSLITDFIYLRRYGPAAAETSPYTLEELKQLAEQVRLYSTDCDLYVFFNNTSKAYAIENARQLKNYL